MVKIPRIKLVVEPETEEARGVIGYRWNEVAGTRHFLGGEPEVTNEGNYPACEDCGSKMTFYAQIDSIGDKYDLADCMVIHNFVCFDCFTVKAVLEQIRT
ncbi:MAG: hypothetical protein RIB86_20055 [Imperialibacter sp.]